MLRALAVWILLQQHRFLCRCAARKSAIHTNRSENETLKDQVAALSCLLHAQLLLTQNAFATTAVDALQCSAILQSRRFLAVEQPQSRPSIYCCQEQRLGLGQNELVQAGMPGISE